MSAIMTLKHLYLAFYAYVPYFFFFSAYIPAGHSILYQCAKIPCDYPGDAICWWFPAVFKQLWVLTMLYILKARSWGFVEAF